MRFGARWRDGTPILVKARVPPDRGLPYVLPARISVHSGSQCGIYAVYMGKGIIQRGLHTVPSISLDSDPSTCIVTPASMVVLHAVRKPGARPMDSWLRPAEDMARSAACPCSENSSSPGSPRRSNLQNSHRLQHRTSSVLVLGQHADTVWFLRKQGTVAFFSFFRGQSIQQGVVQFILSAGGKCDGKIVASAREGPASTLSLTTHPFFPAAKLLVPSSLPSAEYVIFVRVLCIQLQCPISVRKLQREKMRQETRQRS